MRALHALTSPNVDESHERPYSMFEAALNADVDSSSCMVQPPPISSRRPEERSCFHAERCASVVLTSRHHRWRKNDSSQTKVFEASAVRAVTTLFRILRTSI